MKRAPVLLTVILMAAAFSPARAASPSLGAIMPRGLHLGTEGILYFNGARLADAKEILLYYPGVTVSKLEVVNDNQVKATVKVAADCRLGEHVARVRTASGISELLTFYVGALPVVAEKEPNNDMATAQKIPLNVTVTGVVDAEDVDYFAVEAKKGQRLTAEIEGMRLGATLFDPYIAILDAKRFELAACDDSPLLGQDAVVSTIIPADGTYYVMVRESAYGGNGGCQYRLHVGTFPRPLGVFPAGGKLGEETEVTFLGDVAGEFKQKFKLPAAVPAEKFGVLAQDAGGLAPSHNPFRLSPYGNVMEVEPNDTHQTATRVPELPIALNGIISKAGDVDHFRFTVKKGQTYDVHCYARRLGSPLDSVMTLAPFGGGVILANDDAVGPDSYFRFTAPADGDYVLAISDHLGKGGPTYFYRVEFTSIQPKVTLSLPKVDFFGYSQERQTLPIPRGNRIATLVSASRADCGGEITVTSEGLPKGVTLHAENVAANLDVVPVVFEAAPDAPVAGGLARLLPKPADPAQKFLSSYLQSVILIAVPNQGIYWRHDLDRAAIAVTDEVPFKISIVEPKAPLVQNGSMNLKIVAERKPGYKAPITIYPLFNPPGVGSAGSVVIPENGTEVLLPMNAAGNAQVRKWKTAVIAQAPVGNGPIWVSSQLATIEIATPFLTFQMERAAAEQGKPTDLFCKVTQHTPFDGTAKVTLLGLPAKVTAPVMDITKDTKEFAFKVQVDKTSPPGQHGNIFCQVVLTKNNEPVVHNLGGTQLRIDVPLPPKANEPPKPAAPVAQKAPEPAKTQEKRLTRLEKLRLEQEEREKAAKEQKK